MDNFCEILKQMRGKNGWSQEDLARRLGVSLSTVQRWEKDLCLPSRLARPKVDALFVEMGIPQRFGGII